VTRFRTGRSGLDSRQEQRIFFFATASGPVLEFFEPHTQRVPWSLSPGIRRPGNKANHSPSSNAEVTNAWSYTSTLPTSSWRRSTGTSLPLSYSQLSGPCNFALLAEFVLGEALSSSVTLLCTYVCIPTHRIKFHCTYMATKRCSVYTFIAVAILLF
jgi:hypothetical protein